MKTEEIKDLFAQFESYLNNLHIIYLNILKPSLNLLDYIFQCKIYVPQSFHNFLNMYDIMRTEVVKTTSVLLCLFRGML